MCLENPQHSHDAEPFPGEQGKQLYTTVRPTIFDFPEFEGRQYRSTEDGVTLSVAVGADDGSISIQSAPADNFEGSAEVILSSADATRLVEDLRASAHRSFGATAPLVLNDERMGTYLSVAADSDVASFNTRWSNEDPRRSWDSEVLLTPEQTANLADFLAARPGQQPATVQESEV